MKFDKEDILDDLVSPTGLPQTVEQASLWQEANRSWWEKNPMRYDWKSEIRQEEFTPGFYAEIDRRFFADAKAYMPWRKYPFDPLIDFDFLQGKDVLEIGVGNGSHAQLLAQHAGSFTGIDITDYAVRSTSARMLGLGLQATILRMDAECMQFEANTFDFIWSWGVIHHSSNTRRVLQEMHRVLRPGGQAITMVYHRSFWNYYIMSGLCFGLLHGDLSKTKSIHKTVQKKTDGALARYYSGREWARLVSELFSVKEVLVFGSKAEIVPLPGGRMKTMVMSVIPDGLGRFLTNQCRMGSFLVSKIEKIA